MKNFILTIAILGVSGASSLGLSPRTDSPYVEAGIGSEVFFVMIPHEVTPFGKCYRIDENGDPKLLWTVKGWYSPAMHTTLSYSGKYLVRFLLPYATNITPAEIKVKPYLEIYADGIFVKSLLVKDLVDSKNLPARLPYVFPLLKTDNPIGNRAAFSTIWLMKSNDQVKPFIPEDLDENSEVFNFGITDAENVMILLKNGKVLAHFPSDSR